MSINLRAVTTNDFAQIRALAAAVLTPTYQDQERVERAIKRNYSDEAFTISMNSENKSLIVADKDGHIIGFCQYGLPLAFDEACQDEDIKAIHRLLIHPDYRRQGVGSALLEMVEDDIDPDAEVQRLMVYINLKSEAQAQIRFYAKHGFYHDLVEDTEDEWYMEKDLN